MEINGHFESQSIGMIEIMVYNELRVNDSIIQSKCIFNMNGKSESERGKSLGRLKLFCTKNVVISLVMSMAVGLRLTTRNHNKWNYKLNVHFVVVGCYACTFVCYFIICNTKEFCYWINFRSICSMPLACLRERYSVIVTKCKWQMWFCYFCQSLWNCWSLFCGEWNVFDDLISKTFAASSVQLIWHFDNIVAR